MQKHVNLVDLVKSFPTNIYLQNLASIQKRTSPVKFAHLAEKSGKGSISNLSTKVFSAEALDAMSEQNLRQRGLDVRDLLQKIGDEPEVPPREKDFFPLSFFFARIGRTILP